MTEIPTSESIAESTRTHDFDRAIALITAEAGSTDTKLATLEEIGRQARIAECWHAASTAYTRAEDLAIASGLPSKAAEVLVERGRVERLSERFQTAEVSLREALRRFEGLRDDSGPALAYLELGVLARLRHEWSAAAALLEQAHAHASRSDKRSQLVRICCELAVIQRLRGHFSEARDRLEESVSNFSTDDKEERAYALFLNGTVSAQAGMHTVAIQHLTEALDLYSAISMPRMIDYTRIRLGNSLHEDGKTEHGLHVLQEALLSRQQAGDQLGAANCCVMQAEILIAIALPKEVNEAIELLSEAREQYSRKNESHGVVHCDWKTGEAFLALGRIDEAFTSLRIADAKYTEIGSPPEHGSTLNLLAQASMQIGDLAAAQDYAARAIRLATRLRARILPADLRIGTYKRARSWTITALKVAAQSENSDLALQAIDFARSDALAAALSLPEDLTDKVPGRMATLLRAAVDLSAEVDTMERHQTVDAAPQRHLREELEHVVSNLQSLTSEEYLRLSAGRNLGDVGLRAARQLRQPLWCLDLNMEEGCEQAFSVFVSSDGSSQVQACPLGKDAIALIRAFQEGDSLVTYSRKRRAWHELAIALIPPALLDYLSRALYPKPLLAVVGGALWGLPLAALPIDGQPLVTKAVLGHLPSIQLATLISSRRGPVGSGCIVDIDDKLPGARSEIEALERFFPPVLPMDLTAATDGHLDGRDRQLLAISGHGTADVGLGQGVFLSNGRIWRAAHALTTQLPSVVVLGACWASRPKSAVGDEPIGLATVALLRGANSVVGGIFEVNSLGTAMLLKHMYRAQADGLPLARALQSAQANMVRAGQPLADWAGLITVGIPI